VEEKGMLEDLILAAVNDGMRKAREMASAEMAKLTGGLKIPGLMP
jgi:nucleoid-associated protein EbfC